MAEKPDCIPNPPTAGDAALFREEAGRARRLAAAMRDRQVAERLHHIAALYDLLAAGQGVGPTDRD